MAIRKQVTVLCNHRYGERLEPRSPNFSAPSYATVRCECPDALLTELFDAGERWIADYLAAPRPPSPLPPEIDDTDMEVMHDGFSSGQYMSESLPPLRGDTWHCDPSTHCRHIQQWERVRETLTRY